MGGGYLPTQDGFSADHHPFLREMGRPTLELLGYVDKHRSYLPKLTRLYSFRPLATVNGVGTAHRPLWVRLSALCIGCAGGKFKCDFCLGMKALLKPPFFNNRGGQRRTWSQCLARFRVLLSLTTMTRIRATFFRYSPPVFRSLTRINYWRIEWWSFPTPTLR